MPADPYALYYIVGAALFGLLLGSFLNVCIYRIPRDLSVISPRSFCPECGSRIAWYDNIPVLSYVFLRGECRSCGKVIGLRYPAVELAMAGAYTVVAIRYGWTLAALKWMIFEALVIALFWTDLEERILPDELTLGGTAVGLILAAFVQVPGGFAGLFWPWRSAWRSIADATVAAMLLTGPIWLVGKLYERVRKREALGLGDVKLLLLFGVFLGLENGLMALLIGALSGSVIGLIYIFATRKKVSETELPFGSFLCAGAAFLPLVRNFGLDVL